MRCFSPSAHDRSAACQLLPQTSSQRRVARAAQARRRSLSLGRRRSTRACFARARCCTGCDRFMSRRKILHRREGSLFWCAAVVRRASCGLQLQASAAWLARRRRVGARCLSGGDAVLELSSRARDPLWLWSVLTLPKGAATARHLFPSAHDRCATCQLRPPTSSLRRVSRAAQACGRSLSLGTRRGTLACFACARCGRSVSCQRTLSRRDASFC
jgi:hypothetical protein